MTNARINRRTAVRWTSATVATAGLAAWLRQPIDALGGSPQDETAADPPGHSAEAAPAGPLPYMDRIGLQLYTVRDQMAKDPAATLQAVADAGYAQVELMNIDAQTLELAAIARDKGLLVHSAFMDFNVITEPTRDGVLSVDATLELAERIGLRHVVFGYIAKNQRDTADKCRAIADRANAAADAARSAGLRMCYHNHAFEFGPFAPATPDVPPQDSPTAFDIFVERFDPHKMEFELDVFWAKLAGRDPIEMMRRLSGRISQVHLKDLKAGTPTIFDESEVPKDAFQELGDGTIDIPAVMRLAREIGVDQCHVEQDQSPEPIASIGQSAAYLRERSS